MPVHVEELTSEVSVIDGDMPFSEAQLEELIRRILKRLEEKQREARQLREATQLREHATEAEAV